MAGLAFKTDRGASTTLSPEALDALRRSLHGEFCLSDQPGYDEARTIWNAMIDRRPAGIVRAAGVEDVIRTVHLAAEHKLLLAVRGGGHHIAGNAVCDGGLMLDLSRMRAVRVDSGARTARVEPGATLADLDRATQEFGLAVPVGINSTTGVAGLALGGGFGWLSRKYGLTIDNLLTADVVTARGELVHANSKENADLFWGIRGGGGNFGVVTSFDFRLHSVGPQVLAGLIVHPFANVAQVLDEYRTAAAEAPDELTCWVVLRKAPPLPFLPAEVHGKEIVVLALCYAGAVSDGEKAAAPFRRIGKPIADVVGPQPFVSWQSTFDPLLAPGARNYWKSHDLRELGDGTISALIDFTRRLPTPECEIFLAHLGGAVNRVPVGETAYPHRDVNFVVNVHTRWRQPSQDKECIGWAREFFDAVAPFATGGVYVNFMSEDEAQRVRPGAYGANYGKLAKLKAKWDPQNLFRMNHNVPPA